MGLLVGVGGHILLPLEGDSEAERCRGEACGSQWEGHRGGSARERPGMFWNSKASLAGGGDAWERSWQASGAAEDDLPRERWAPWDGSC